MSRTQCGR